MHRSITFSEIFSSTFSNNNNEKNVDDGAKNIFIARVAIGVVEFFAATIFLSYGIIFSEYVDKNIYSVESGIWTTIIYISTWHMTGPFARNVRCAIFNERTRFKYVIATSAICLSVGLLMPEHIRFYGIFGGIFCNIITTQLKLVATEVFEFDLKLFEGNVQCGRALSLLIMPHLILFLIEYYTIEQMKLIFSAILLHIVPFVLLIRPPNKQELLVDEDPELSRYNTLPGLSQQMREMVDFTNLNFTSDINYTESPSAEDNEKVSTQIEIEPPKTQIQGKVFEESQVEDLVHRAPLLPSVVQDYFSKAGVTILPGIPEEKETEEDNTNDNVSGNIIDPKRLSVISAKLEELNQNDRSEGIEVMNINDLILKHKNRSIEEIQNIEYIQNYRGSVFLGEVEFIDITSYCSCPTYKIFSWKRKLRLIKDFLVDYFFRPLTDLNFYFLLVSKVTVTFLTTVFITLAPYLASQKNDDFKKEDAAFLLSYMAFSWCLFLVLLPLVVTFSEKKLRGAFAFGLCVIGCSMIFLCKKKISNDFITLNCLIYGFGFGMISYTENMVYRNHVGVRRWKLLEGSLETLSAIFVTLVYFFIYIYKLNFVAVFPLVAFCMFSVFSILWIVIPICMKTAHFFKNHYFGESEVGESFLSF